MPLARGSGPIIGFALFATLGFGFWATFAGGGAVSLVLTALAGAFALLCLWFFRDPDHDISTVDPGVVIAPGQGKVMSIEEVEEPDHMGGRCRRISIFLSIFDVHVQRAPIGGKVVHRSRRDGGFLAAWNPRAGDTNARASIGIDSAAGPVMVRQITGLVARRIVTYPAIGSTVERGDRVGLIRFGSRVDLFVPLDWQVVCQPGEKALAGVTPLARVPSPVSSSSGPAEGAPADDGASADEGASADA